MAGTLTVTPAGLTITANNQTKVYGAALPTLTASYTGFVNGDTSASLTTQPTLTTTATARSHVSGNPYTITAAGAVDADYTITYVAGSLTVTPAALTITADNQTKVYGAALPTLTASYSGFVNGDTAASLTTQPTLTTTATASSHVSGNPYTITATGAVDSDYTISYAAGTLTVTAGGLDDHRQQPDQGLRRGAADAHGQLLGLRQWRHLRQPDHPAHADDDGHRQQPCLGQPLHDHGQRRGGFQLLDHAMSPGASPSPPRRSTITANNQTKAYGAALPALTASYTGFVNGDSFASLTTQPTLTTHGDRQQPCRGQPVHHHRQRRGRFRLQHQLCRRHAHRHPGGLDDHRQQPDQGLRRGAADPDGQLLQDSSTATQRPASTLNPP